MPTTPALPTPTATSEQLRPGDLDSDGRVDAADLGQLIAEIYDGDGDATADAGGGTVASSPAADVNGDGHITAADCTALLLRWSP